MVRKVIPQLRSHHLLCLPGYKGLNYNETAKTSWDNFSKMMKENPKLKIKIVDGPDSLCLNCPKKGVNCTEESVKRLDEKVKTLLNLKTGGVYFYKALNKKLKDLLDPKKHEKICGDCFWRIYGLCKDTFQK